MLNVVNIIKTSNFKSTVYSIHKCVFAISCKLYDLKSIKSRFTLIRLRMCKLTCTQEHESDMNVFQNLQDFHEYHVSGVRTT